MTRYVIDRTTLFDDEAFELSRVADPASTVLLGAAASRCLTALLEAQGTIVTKKELLYKGWERYGQQVSGNSVNQSVAQVRRCLVSLGQSPDWLVTVPRIGYKVADCLSIETPAAEAAPLAAQPVANVLCAKVEPAVLPRSPWRPGVALGPGARALWRRVRLLGYTCVFLGLNTALAFNWEARRSTSPLASEVLAPYVPVAGHSSPRFFAGATLAGKPEAVERHISRLHRLPPLAVPLVEHPYVYINGTLRSDVYSYFLCRRPIDDAQARCLSYLIVDERVQ